VGLFAALALVMYLTRGIDWYRLHAASPVAPSDANLVGRG
jgi:inner membrane protein involved in colicin E2 resistance